MYPDEFQVILFCGICTFATMKYFRYDSFFQLVANRIFCFRYMKDC